MYSATLTTHKEREREKEGQFFLRKRRGGENTLFSLLLCVRERREGKI